MTWQKWHRELGGCAKFCPSSNKLPQFDVGDRSQTAITWFLIAY
jgi:hypothetical protein